MRTKIFPLVVVCLVCVFFGKAQNVKESESSIIFSEKTAEVALVLENPTDAFDRRVELEIIDAEDKIRANISQNVRIERGKKSYKLTMPIGDLLATADDGVDWFRLRYRVGEKTGIVSLSQLVKDVFQLRVAAAERIFAGMEYQVRVRAVSPADNSPVKKVKITGELEIERDTENDKEDDLEIKSNAETDGEGFAILKFKIPENVDLNDVDLTVKGSKNGIVRDVYEDLDTNEEGGRILLTTDKPLYQPGQDFKVRGLYFDANNTVVTGAELEFKILDEEDTVLFKEKITTSAFGIAALSWRIPDGAKLGSYRVEVDADKDLSEDRLYFKVSRYDLPNFAVKAKPDKEFYLPSDKQAEIAVTADYLFGKPVTKGKVRVVQESERRWNWRAQKYDVQEKGVFEGETDKDGKYVAKVDLGEEFGDLKNDDYDRFHDLHFSAYFTDPTTNRTEQRRFDVRISKEPIHVYLVGRRYDLSPRMPITRYVSTFYADGTPVSCETEVRGKNDDDDDKFKVLQRLKTNSYGAGKIEFERPKNLDASDDLDLKITARSKDGKTGTHEEELEYYNDDDGLQIEAEKAIYKPGESVKANIISSKKTGYVYVDVVKNWTATATYLTKIENGKASLKIPYNPAFKGDLTLAAYDDEKDDYYDQESRDSFGIIFPTEENLKIDAKFEKQVYKPNEDAKISFSSLDGAGDPIETALGVVIFDRAIEERARTDADFGSYFSRYSYFLGYSKAFGGVTLKDLNALDLSKPISDDLQLVAEVMLADNSFYPRIHHGDFSPTYARYVYEKTFKKQFKVIEDALKTQFEKTGESPSNETTLKDILQRNNLNFDEIRDVWGNVYRAVFRVDKTQQILTWKTAGADKIFDTKDDFDVSTQSFAYFEPTGKAIDAAAKNYHKDTGKFIRDRETLRGELLKQNIELNNLKDAWNRDYQIYFEVSGRNYDIRFYSLGANMIYQPNDWNKDDFDVWKISQDYFYKTEQKISDIFARTVNAGKRAFPRNDDEFKQILKENDLDFAQIKDGYGKPVYLTFNKFSRYSDKTVIENGKEKITPVTEEVVNFNIQTEGASQYDTRDNAVLLSFSGVVVEQSKETDYKKKDAKTISFAGNAGAIRGTVTDASGAVIPSATITITDESNSAKVYTTITDENGEFVISTLPPAKYSVRIDASGFKSFLYQNTEVRSQVAVEIKATMEAGGVSEVVTVSADSVEMSVNASVSVVSQRQVAELPVNGRSFSSFLRLAPSARPEAKSGGFQVDGASGSENVFVIDGKEFTKDKAGNLIPLEEKSTPRLREYFPETLLWSPEVITDRNGRAEVKFKLADNITTWKMYAIGSTKNGKVGVTEKEIQAFQPFFVDLEPPKFLTEGDEIHLPTQVRNYTDKKQKVNVTMAKSDWFSFLGNEKQAIEVASGASENAVFGFRAVNSIKGGKQKVTAIADTDSDAIEKPVTVRPNGQEIVRTETKLFSNSAAFDVNFPNNALPKTPNATLKIYPNLMAHVTESVEGLLQRPYGCGEQTISSTYPNLMILKFTRGETNTKKLALKFLQKGYERLIGYQVASGGISYWGGKEEADVALTAYALRFLNDAKLFIAVDEEVIKKAENWLTAQQKADGSFTKKYYWETTEDTSRTKIFTSYVARTLAKIEAEKPDSAKGENAALNKALSYLKTQNARIDEPYALALYGLSLLDAGKADEAKAVAEILTKIAIPENNAVYWKLETNTPFYGWGTAGRVETTALVVQFLIKSKIQNPKSEIANDLVSKGTMFLLKNKDRYGVWYSTQTTINVLDAFLAALSNEAQDAPQNQQINIALNGANVQTISVAPEQIAPIVVDLNGKLNGNENRLEIASSSNSAVMAQTVANHYIDWKDADISGENTNNSRQLQLDYKCDKQTAQIMEEVACSVKAERVGFKGYGMLLAEIGIPPGADVSRESLQTAMENDWSFTRYDILPDRIIIYMWSKAGGTNIDFKFKPRYGINANTPSSFVYDYYNEEAKAVLAPLKFEVK